MSTPQDGGAAAAGGGGAGGKFHKRPFRRPATPYDRPPTGLRGNDNNGNWLTKLVVDPASKLISYGANRFFAPLFRKRLPAPPLLPTQELNHGVSDGLPAADPNIQNGAQEPAGGECSRSVNSSGSNGISDLEKLLKQKTFSRSEIDHLTELLRSKAGEAPIMDDGNRYEASASDFEKHPQLASVPLDKRRYDGDRSHTIVSTPIVNSRVLKDDLASPAELAKAYMGSKPTKVSPSMLGSPGQVGREDNGMLSNRFASQSPIMSLTARTSVGLGAPENGFITPRSRGRSALYSMSRSPYSRVHPTSNVKIHGSGTNHNGYAGATTSFSPVENDKLLEAKPMTLKRRSSVLDDEIRSVGPIRRIRQKSNLISPRIPRSVDKGGVDSHAILASSKQKLLLNGEPKQATKTVGKSANNGAPSTSYAHHVPPKSSEVAAKILQHLETMTPKEKSSESRFVAQRGKSPFKLTSGMLSGQALKSMEDLGSSKLLRDFHDDHKSKDSSNATLPDVADSILQEKEKGKVKENKPRVSFALSDSPYPVINNDSSVSLKASSVVKEASNFDLKSGVSQPPQKKRAFRMSAEEVSFELDDDIQCNGLESRPISEKKGPLEAQHTESKLSPAEEPKSVKTTIVPEGKSPSGLTVGTTSELSSSSTVSVREESTAFPALEKPTTAAQSTVVPLSVAAFDKPKEANNPPSLFGFDSKVANKFSPLPSESNGRISEAKPETSSLVDFSRTTSSLGKIPDSEKADLNPLKPDTVPSAASNGPVASTPSFGLFPAASSASSNELPKSNPNLFNPSISTENSVPASNVNSIFGSAATPSVFGGPTFKFGAAADSSTAVSAAPTTTNPVGEDLKTKSEIDPSSGASSSSLSNLTAFGSTSSGNNFGIGSFAANTLQAPHSTTSSIFGNSSTAPLSSFSGSQASHPSTTFGFTSSGSSTDNVPAVIPSSGPTSASNPSTVASTSGSTPSIFGFGFNTSSSSASPVGSISGSTPPVFGVSSVPSSGISTSSFSSGTSGGIFNFGASSSSSSSAVTSSTTAPVVFGSGWQNPNPSMFASSSPSTGFAFGASSSSTSSAAPNSTPSIFNSPMGPTTSPSFPFTTPASTAPFGNPSSGFSPPSPMNAEDSMAEDTVQSGPPSFPQFGQSAASPPPAVGFMFGSPAPSQGSVFQFGGQQNNQAAPQNPSPFQGSSSFNAGGSFSLGSGGGDKSGRRVVRVNRNKNRKK